MFVLLTLKNMQDTCNFTRSIINNVSGCKAFSAHVTCEATIKQYIFRGMSMISFCWHIIFRVHGFEHYQSACKSQISLLKTKERATDDDERENLDLLFL